MQTFTLPPEADPEPGQPADIRHGCDYMHNPGGTLEFYYNFLDYTWLIAGQKISARCYLDEPDKLNFSVPNAAFGMLDTADILAFVQRRFRTIATLETNGYQTQWTCKPIRVKHG